MEKMKYLQLFSQEGEAEDIGETCGPASREASGEDAPAPARKMTWEEVKADPELNGHLQQMVKDRLKGARHAQDRLDALSGALNIMAQAYGMDSSYDPTALAQAISADRRFQKADLTSHYQSLRQQEAAMRRQVKDFSLEKALENPTFVRLTAPGGVSVEDAYYAVNRSQTLAATAATTARNIATAIASGALRPRENGAAAPSLTTFDYKNADRARRESLKKQIRQAIARGEKLYPDDVM